MTGIWRVSLRRMRADWPIVAATWVITVLAAVLFSAGVIYPAAAAEAGLQRALRDAPVSSRSLEVARYDDPPNVPGIDGAVMAALQDLIAGPGGSIIRDWRGSATLALVTGGAQNGDQVEVGFLDGLPEHATLVAGAWPTDGSGGAGRPAEVAIAQPAAEALGVHVGDAIEAIARPGSGARDVQFRVAAVYAAADATAAFWNEDADLLTGLHDNGRYRTFGPLLVTMAELTRVMAEDELNLRWRVLPDFDKLQVDDAGRMAAGIDSTAGRLLVETGLPFNVNATLPVILREADRSLLVSRTSVVLLMAQLALLAGYAIVLMATLLVDHRRVDTALLRARGASSGHVALLSLVEALIFAGTAVVVAPTIAAVAVSVFNVYGPLAEVGLRLVPAVGTGAYVAAGAAGALCVLLLVLPAVRSARAFAQEQSGMSRQETRTLGQRLGLDVVLLAVTAIAMWQLRLYGAPLTRSVQGQLGLDPLLVAAPAIGLIAGGVVALRLLPLIAELAEKSVSRGRGLLSSLGARQLARRPLRYTRSALLLVLAVSMGVFALSYASTWAGSQRDQATYQAGADVRLPAAGAGAGSPASTLAGALAAMPDVEAVTPVERISDGVKFGATGSADLVALDAQTAGQIVRMREDAASITFSSLLPALAGGRPTPSLPVLPDGTRYLRVLPVSTIASASIFVFDDASPDGGQNVPVDPATLPVQMSAGVVLRDAHGLMYMFRSSLVEVSGASPEIVIPVDGGDATGQAQRLDGPVAIASLGVEVWLPELSQTADATFGISAVMAGSSAAGPWSDVPLAGSGPWSAAFGQGHQAAGDVPAARVVNVAVEFRGGDPSGAVAWGGSGPAGVLRFLPSGVDPAGGVVPVVANRAFVDAFDASIGDVITASVSGRFSRLSITGMLETFPTTDPDRPLLIADESTVSVLRLRTVTPTRPVDEWWLAARPGTAETVAATLAAAPFDRPGVISAPGRARELSTDPVALGIIGALTLGFVTTGLFAIVGMTVSAGVSARQQRTEFALLRALGLSGRQLSGSLWLEHGSVVVLGLLAGTGLGLLIAWLVLPFVTVTQGGVAPVPPVEIAVPWGSVLALDLASAAALGIGVLVIGSVLRRLRVGATLRMGED